MKFIRIIFIHDAVASVEKPFGDSLILLTEHRIQAASKDNADELEEKTQNDFFSFSKNLSFKALLTWNMMIPTEMTAKTFKLSEKELITDSLHPCLMALTRLQLALSAAGQHDIGKELDTANQSFGLLTPQHLN